MPANTPRRGRPKGSGLDDSEQLAAIAALIEQDPNLKPTTAIRALGVADPSTIRRLRDKYRKFANDVEIGKPELPPQRAKRQETPKSTLAKSSRTQIRPNRASSTQRQPRSSTPTTASAEALGEPASWFMSYCGLGIQAMSTTIEIQAAAFKHMITSPPIAFALKGPCAMNDLALFLYKNQKPLLMRS